MADQDLRFEDYRKRLDRKVEEFQNQTSLPLWIFADSDAIRAAAFDRPFRFGPRGRVVHWIFKRTGRSKASLATLWVFGFAVIMRWWFGALMAKRVLVRGVFVGTGAGAEEQLFEKFESELDGRSARMFNDIPRSWGSVSKPSLTRLFGQLSAECTRVYGAIKRSGDPSIGGRFCMWMALNAMRIGKYIFARAWAAGLPANVKRVVFISPDIFCFAAVDARGSDQRHAIEYWQHGLLYRSIIFPKLDRVVALDYPEGMHINRLCGSPFRLSTNYENPNLGITATLLFASIYDAAGFAKSNFIHVLQEYFGWARGQGLSVVIRPHPREDDSFWLAHFSGIQVDRSGDPFPACVEHWKPMFVASWFSTALIDALRLGFAPVLITEGSLTFLRDMVLPLDQIALNWPANRTMMETIVRNQTELRHWVRQRREEVFSPLREL